MNNPTTMLQGFDEADSSLGFSEVVFAAGCFSGAGGTTDDSGRGVELSFGSVGDSFVAESLCNGDFSFV